MIKLIEKFFKGNYNFSKLEMICSNCLVLLVAISLLCMCNPYEISQNFIQFIPKVKGDYPINCLLWIFLLYRSHLIRSLGFYLIDLVCDKLNMKLKSWAILQSLFDTTIKAIVIVLFILFSASFIQLVEYSALGLIIDNKDTLQIMILIVICFFFEQVYNRYCFYIDKK